MKSKRAARVNLLLLSCWFSLIIAGFFFAGMIYQLILGNANDAISSILTSLFFLLFALQAGVTLYLISKYYPSADIPSAQFMIHRIITTLVIIEIVFVVVGVIGLLIMEQSSTGFSKDLRDPIILAVFISLVLLVISQVHILFVGSSVIGRIRDDYRKALIDNW